MKLDGQAKQHNVSIEDTTVIKCDNKKVDLEKGIEMVCGGASFPSNFISYPPNKSLNSLL